MNQTHSDEQAWRIFVAFFAIFGYLAITVVVPSYSTLPQPSPSAGIKVGLLVMVPCGLLFMGLMETARKYWLSSVCELTATALAPCSAWIWVEGMPKMPRELQSIQAFLMVGLVAELVWAAAWFRVLEPNQRVTHKLGRIIWEALLPASMFGATYFVLEGWPLGAAIIAGALMLVLMQWKPSWRAVEIQTCEPG